MTFGHALFVVIVGKRSPQFQEGILAPPPGSPSLASWFVQTAKRNERPEVTTARPASPSTLFSTPPQQQRSCVMNTTHEKVAALLSYLELGSPSAVRLKLLRSGKEPFVVFRKNVENKRAVTTAPAAYGLTAPATPTGVRFGTLVDQVPEQTPAVAAKPGTTEVADTLVKGFSQGLRRQLRKVFAVYCNLRSAFGEQMGPSGFHKLCRDCKLLDSGFGYAEADIILTHQDAGAPGAGATRKSDRRLNFDEFLSALREVGAVKFPAASQGTMKDAEADSKMSAVGQVVHDHILKYGFADNRHPDIVKGLSTSEVFAEFKLHRNTLKGVFTHYAALDTISEAMREGATWESISRTNRTINLDEFLMFALNFDIVPHLLPKFAMVGVFRASNSGLSADDHEEEMTYDEFVEALGRAALLASTVAEEKLSGKIHAAIHELSAVRRFVSFCETDEAYAYYEGLDGSRRRGDRGNSLASGSGGTDISFRDAARREARHAVENALKLEREVANNKLDAEAAEKLREVAVESVVATGSRSFMHYAAFLKRGERRPRTTGGMQQAHRRNEVATQARGALMRSLGVTSTLNTDVFALNYVDRGSSLREYIEHDADGILAKPREIRRAAAKEAREARRGAKADVATFMAQRPRTAPKHACDTFETFAETRNYFKSRVVTC